MIENLRKSGIAVAAIACLFGTLIPSMSGGLQPIPEQSQQANREENKQSESKDEPIDELSGQQYELANGRDLSSTQMVVDDNQGFFKWFLDPLGDFRDEFVDILASKLQEDPTLFFPICSVIIAWFICRALPVFLQNPTRFLTIFGMGVTVIAVLFTLVGDSSAIATLLYTPLLALFLVALYTYVINIGRSLVIGVCTILLIWISAGVLGGVKTRFQNAPDWLEPLAYVVVTLFCGALFGVWLYVTDFANRSTEDNPLMEWGRARRRAAKQQLALVTGFLWKRSPTQDTENADENADATGSADASNLTEQAGKANVQVSSSVTTGKV